MEPVTMEEDYDVVREMNGRTEEKHGIKSRRLLLLQALDLS